MKVKILDDFYSVLHVVFGFIAGLLPKNLSLIFIVVYVFYQAFENKYRGEPKGNLIGDFIEFFTGYSLGVLVSTVFL